MTYGYARVSTVEQNEARQLYALQNSGIKIDHIFVDKASGKDFIRPKYQSMRALLKKGDFLIVQSLDRFGRSYDDIIDEWRYLVKTVGIDIKVLDMPLLDTKTGNGLVGKFVGDIVLQILSFVAEMERRKIKERQAQGIAIAKQKGIRFGRPKLILPPKFEESKALYLSHRLSLRDAADMAGMTSSTFHRHVTGWYDKQPSATRKENVAPIEEKKVELSKPPPSNPKPKKEEKPIDDGGPRKGRKPTVAWVMNLPPAERKQYSVHWTPSERLEAKRIELRRINSDD